MSPRPLLFRVLPPLAIVLVTVMVVLISVGWWSGQRTLRFQQGRDLDRLAGHLRREIGANGGELSAEQRRLVEHIGQVLGSRITLIDGSGKVLADTHGDAPTMDNHNTRPEVIQARSNGRGSSIRASDTTRESMTYLAQLLDSGQPNGVVVRVSQPWSMWSELNLPIGSILAAVALGAALLTIIVMRTLMHRWITPIHDLAAAADRMSSGDWQARVEPAGTQDVRFLGGRFNVMAAAAQKQLSDLRVQRSDLRALVDSLPDPVLLTDSEDRIILINTPAAGLLQLRPDQALGKRMGVAVNEESILRVMEDARKGVTITREIRLQRSGQHVTYQAVATASQGGGVLLVLRNITAMAMAVQMKTDFVANASHELRTPIAAIKMAFETLQEVYREDPTQTGKCITIIEGHLRRLEEMLGDLLDLSRVESPDLNPQMTSIKVDDLFSFVRSSVGSMASLKGVEIETLADGPLAELSGDRHLLELVLKNLVENSVKYTPSGGKVTVSFIAGEGSSVLEVIDTGIGIPPEHQERVFERFYQVDPARSGSAGRGTGLGLAIVKHAVHALGGTVKLTSAVGVGTKVRCTLPQADIPASSSVETTYP